MPHPSRWYVALLVLECIVGQEPQDEPDVQIRLIEASDHESAYDAALAMGRRAEHSYSNANGQHVAWNFRGLFDLQEVDQVPKHGVELYSFRPGRKAAELVKSRQELTAFWFEANKNRVARDVLEEE